MVERLNQLMLDNQEDYKPIYEFISKKHSIALDDVEDWILESDMRIYKGIDTEVVIDAWFEVQHIYSGGCGKGRCCLEGAKTEVNDDKFTIIVPCGYRDSYTDKELTFDNTKEGLEKAFFSTIMGECVSKFTMENEDYYICVDEM